MYIVYRLQTQGFHLIECVSGGWGKQKPYSVEYNQQYIRT